MSEGFKITERAASRIITLREMEKNPNLKLRVEVLGGGCSGFQYKFELENGDKNASDRVYTLNGAEVIIDDLSLDLLKNSVLDFHEDLSGASFVINNPNAVAKCGCGNSFAL